MIETYLQLYTYDGMGCVTEMRYPNGWVEYDTYDEMKLINYLQNDSSKRIRVAPTISKLHVAYSLLMTRQYDAALPYFNAVRNDLSQYTIESANKQLATIEKIISMIEKKDYYEISIFLKQTITDVKTVCGLVQLWNDG